MNDTPLLEASNLSFAYEQGQGRMVFQEAALSLHAGDIYSLLGANGAGKSTLLSCLRWYLKPAAGTIHIKGKNIAVMSSIEIARIIGFTSQSSDLSGGFTVRDYVTLGCSPRLGFFAMPGKAEYEKAEEIMEALEITGLGKKTCGALSGGELRQAQIARTLMQEPELILMDEPVNHLDLGNQLKILRMILSLSRKGIAVLFTTHNPDHAILLGARAGILDSGRLLSGITEEIINEERLRSVYREPIYFPFVPSLSRRVCAAGALI